MCRPGHGPSRHPFTGGHIGPPLHNAGNVPEITESGVENEHFPNGAGRSPPPTGAPPAVRSNGPMYLGHGFRQPNSETEFGASVIGIGPYGWLQKVAATSRAALSEAESAGIVAGQIQFLPDK